MVQFFKGSPDPRDAAVGKLGEALGMGIGQKINTHFANKAIDEVINDESLTDAPVSERMGKLQRALSPYGEVGQQLLQQRVAIEQQRQVEEEQSILGKAVSGKEVTPKELSKVSPQNQLKLFDIQKRKQAGKSVYDSLKKSGYPEETAALWQNQMENAPTGGQTDVIRQVNDLIRRSKTGKGLNGEQEEKPQIKPSIQIPGITDKSLELDFPELPEPVGLTPSDVVKQNEYREKTNTPLYKETVDRLNALDDEYREVSHLQDLDATDKLPQGIGRWNVNWDTGDLRIKGLASPEAQDYVKTIARMARRAKDFFPGRVTNFDLDQFKQGFATLANSKEGRKLISEQLSLGNRIAYLKDETYKAAVEHYGSGADPVLITKYATQNYRRLKGDLESQLKAVNEKATDYISKQPTETPETNSSFESLPTASEYSGKKIKDNETGKVFKSDGTKWIPE